MFSGHVTCPVDDRPICPSRHAPTPSLGQRGFTASLPTLRPLRGVAPRHRAHQNSPGTENVQFGVLGRKIRNDAFVGGKRKTTPLKSGQHLAGKHTLESLSDLSLLLTSAAIASRREPHPSSPPLGNTLVGGQSSVMSVARNSPGHLRKGCVHVAPRGAANRQRKGQKPLPELLGTNLQVCGTIHRPHPSFHRPHPSTSLPTL